jgi:hypothetical protein
MDDSALLARKTWRTLEPLHGMIYFAPEATAAYEKIGIQGTMGYFASRSAPMGAVSAGVVIASFFNFNPELVRAAIPGAWAIASPAQLLEARLDAVDQALVRMLGDTVTSSELARAATLARVAAEAACERPEGRVLFAGHASLAWPEAPHLVLWHAQSLLREYRGDGHLVALLDADLGPLEALVSHAASGEVPAEVLRVSRAWSKEDWALGVERLAKRGWLQDGDTLAFNEEGQRVRARIESLTDQLSTYPYEQLGEERCAELRQLARPFSKAVVDQGSLGAMRRDPSNSRP